MYVLQLLDELTTEKGLSDVREQAQIAHFEGKHGNPYPQGSKYAEAWAEEYRECAWLAFKRMSPRFTHSREGGS